MHLLRLNLCCLVLLSLVSCDSGNSPTIVPPAKGKADEAMTDQSKTCREALDKRLAKDALENCEQVLRAKASHQDSLEYAEASERMGEALVMNGKILQGISLFQDALKIREKLPAEKESVATADLQFKLANLLSAQNNFADAEFLLKESLAIREKINGTDAVEVALILNSLGIVQLHEKLLSDAEHSLRRALEIREKKLGARHAETGKTLNNMGLVFQLSGKLQDAEGYLRKSLAIQETALGPDHPSLHDILVNLASLLENIGKLAEAEKLWKRALTIEEKQPDHETPAVAKILYELGMMYYKAGNLGEANSAFRRSLSIRESKLGPNHLQTAETENAIAVVLVAQGKRTEALPLLRHATAVAEVVLGSQNPVTQQRWKSLVNTLAMQTTSNPTGVSARPQSEAEPGKR